MEVRFNPEFEAHDKWFKAEVQKGLEQLDRGEFVDHDALVARIERMFHS